MKHFLGHRFDEQDRTLWRGAEEVRLTRKAAAVLLCLIEHAGKVVTRETMLSTVWSATHVQSDNIKVLVHEIRGALNDDPRDPHFIRSEPRSGYTFVAPVFDALLAQPEYRDSAVTSIFVNHHDLSRLGEALTDPNRAECRVFLIEGERGGGKTALSAEFMKLARAAASAHVGYGQAVAHAGTAEPYQPIVDALHHLARQSPTIVPALLAQHAPAWLAKMPYWVIDAAPAIDRVTTVEPSRMIRELGEFFASMATDRPIAMVLEDLQWGDLETVELMRALSRRHSPLRAMVVATYTPHASTVAAAAVRNLAGEMRAGSRCWPTTLGPLSEEQVRGYLVQRFGSGSIEGLTRVVHRVSAGNPLVMVSLMDALFTGGSLVLQGNAWRLRHSPRTIERSLPASVLDALLWRFEQLDAEDRVVLESAAAVGMEFCVQDVAKAAGVESPIPMGRRLEGLFRRGFVLRRGGKKWNGPAIRAVYRFIHPLHPQVLAANAPVFDQLRAAERMTLDATSIQRFG